MKIIRFLLIAGTLAGAVAGNAYAADSSMPATQEHHWQMDPAKRAAMIDRHLQKLHDELAIQPSQEAAWKNFADGIKARINQPRAQFDRNATLPERMDRRAAMMEKHLADFKQQAAVTRELYKQLNPQQQKTLDEKFRHFADHRPWHHHLFGSHNGSSAAK